MLLRLTLLGLLLGLLFEIFRLLLPELLLFLNRVQDVGVFYQFRVIWADPLIFQLLVFLSIGQFAFEGNVE